MSETDASISTADPAADGDVPTPTIPPEERLVHEETVSFGGPSELVVTIVEAIASVRDLAPTEILPVIQESVDTDGLERVFRSHPSAPNRRGWVTFFFCDCRVVLTADGLLWVFDRRPAE
jgi:hypothetical protein